MSTYILINRPISLSLSLSFSISFPISLYRFIYLYVDLLFINQSIYLSIYRSIDRSIDRPSSLPLNSLQHSRYSINNSVPMGLMTVSHYAVLLVSLSRLSPYRMLPTHCCCNNVWIRDYASVSCVCQAG